MPVQVQNSVIISAEEMNRLMPGVKANNTNLVKNYGKWFNLPYAITYFYNVYGGREISEGKYATLIGIFSRKYKNNESLTITSPGIQRRAFTYINDTVDGLMLVGEKGKGDGYCIGSEKTLLNP